MEIYLLPYKYTTVQILKFQSIPKNYLSNIIKSLFISFCWLPHER